MIMGLGALISLLNLLAGFLNTYFSDTSVLHRLQLALERQSVRASVERERLIAANKRIDAAPDKTGQDLTDSLNDKFKKDKPE